MKNPQSMWNRFTASGRLDDGHVVYASDWIPKYKPDDTSCFVGVVQSTRMKDGHQHVTIRRPDGTLDEDVPRSGIHAVLNPDGKKVPGLTDRTPVPA